MKSYIVEFRSQALELSCLVSPFWWAYLGGLYADINERQEERMKKSIFFTKIIFTSNVFGEGVFQNPVKHLK